MRTFERNAKVFASELRALADHYTAKEIMLDTVRAMKLVVVQARLRNLRIKEKKLLKLLNDSNEIITFRKEASEKL